MIDTMFSKAEYNSLVCYTRNQYRSKYCMHLLQCLPRGALLFVDGTRPLRQMGWSNAVVDQRLVVRGHSGNAGHGRVTSLVFAFPRIIS